MPSFSRRTFLGYSAAAAGLGFCDRGAFADPGGFPVGLQLYTVGQDLEKDFEGTMRRIAEIGYRQIEGGLSIAGRDAKAIGGLAKSLDLGWRSIHTSVPELQGGAQRIFDQARENGIEYVICAAPWAKDPSRIKPLDPSDPLFKSAGKYAPFVNILNNLTLDDWKWLVDVFNETGVKAKAAGLTFGYHNHNFEFKKIDGVMPYDLLIEKTDPQYVSFELDCGWMVSAGFDPVAYLSKHPDRYRLLHIKDLAPNQPAGGILTTEVGSGTIDWRKIFIAAKKTKVTGYYVEQEPPYERPPLESARISYDYLHRLTI
ncbi:MAG: sugar phosphate isomerase/epimerase [Caulobacteraceae bacterium]|nr:sugar phosphate isomerase/epimerase [Caulobacteraceae bacterium]